MDELRNIRARMFELRHRGASLAEIQANITNEFGREYKLSTIKGYVKPSNIQRAANNKKDEAYMQRIRQEVNQKQCAHNNTILKYNGIIECEDCGKELE